MKNEYWRTLIGILLVVIGGTALLQALGYISVNESLFAVLTAIVFIFAGLIFLSVLFRDHNKWWAAIPGIILIDLGLLIVFSQFFPQFSNLGGGFFLAGVGLSFWVVYFLFPRKWWAIIPGGVMFTLAIVAVFGDVLKIQSGSILFLGLAVTFGLLGFLTNSNGVKMKWPWYPAAACLALAFLISLTELRLALYLWPVVLILVGIFLVARTFIRKEKE
jgi:hypothetical protein